jgi:hypothetical protein
MVIVFAGIAGIAVLRLFHPVAIASLGNLKVAENPTDTGSNVVLRSNTRAVSNKGCVNYNKFSAELGFNPSSVLTPDAMFRTIKRLVFFVGHARSGSTTIGRLLDAHPHVTVTNEVSEMCACVYVCARSPVSSTPSWWAPVTRYSCG